MTIYIGIQPNKLAESRLIINLFFSQLINVNTRELPQNNPELKHQCLLLMDELTSIGRVDILASSVSYMAGYNIRLLPIIQSMAQLDATYGKDVSRTIITNHALQIIDAPREQQDANDYSEMLGYTTVSKESVTRGRDTSRSHSDERRALMLPQELKSMGTDKEVILFEGIPHPVKCDKIRYYEDKRFTARLLPKVDVPMMQLEGSVPMVKKSIALAAVSGLAFASTAELSAAATKVQGQVASVSADKLESPANGAKRSMDRFIGFVAGLNARSELTHAHVESGLGITLRENDNGEVYTSPALGAGWVYSVELLKAGPNMKNGLAFGFYNANRAADPLAVCAVSLDQVRSVLAAGGFAENITPGEHGQVVAWNFEKNDIVMTITPGGVVTRTDGSECVRAMQTTD
jgi:type IV secretion system protein VirD4